MSEHTPAALAALPEAERNAIEAAAFRRLINHLDGRRDVQNLALMDLSGFCRNCLSRWLREEAAQQGTEIPDAEARQYIYRMPYSQWKSDHQKTH